MRLSDDLAINRHLYTRAIATLPDVLLIDVPLAFASTSLPLGRYYPVILETIEERQEFEAFLQADRPAPIVPDLLDRRASALTTIDIVFALFDPTIAGWPWLLLCRWPADHVALAADQGDMFARDAYTIEIFPDSAARAAAISQLLAILGTHQCVQVVPVTPAAPAGTA
ncbi:MULTISPECIES: hypothetical protein [Sphingobium]|jgi:hypothetical protein|uniref:hypothetical protein n=1 Tax=Sphingobium TaxID=165695 RepID=UPI00082D28F1|nr:MULTISPECIES: hypothetical protein [Sphingobium]MBV2150338.1 hypothetical protein [Sphingobium sp. AS12]QWT14277.1 hypothetical protein GTV57_00215 [Sphingobium xenophagum]|tara:strand:- start:47 stop:553 length:507 start_codon:yes stop_codon:yes gene_type:complete